MDPDDNRVFIAVRSLIDDGFNFLSANRVHCPDHSN